MFLLQSRRLFSSIRNKPPKAVGNISSINMLGTPLSWDTPTKAHHEELRKNMMFKRSRYHLHQLESNPTLPAFTEDEEKEPSFYSEDIDNTASRDLQPVTLQRLLQICRPPLTRETLLEDAQYLSHERPVRYAKRVKLFQRLPFIVNSNPHINSVYRIYYANFIESRSFPLVESLDEERQFIDMLTRHSQNLLNIMPSLAQGFYESRNYFGVDQRRQFLDQVIKMRIGLRLLTSQHVALYHQFQATLNGTYDKETLDGRLQGIVDNKLPLHQMVDACAQGVQAICDIRYGKAPDYVIDGDTGATFPYIPSHMEYMLTELLKNAFQATVVSNRSDTPSVTITISKGNGRVAIRIRDGGGGILQEIHNKVFNYSFTTTSQQQDESVQQPPVSGLGFGLPMAKIYAEYFGGSLNLISLEGHGCDVFLELPSINPNTRQAPKVTI